MDTKLYCPKLIRPGINTMTHLSSKHILQLPHRYKSIYRKAGKHLRTQCNMQPQPPFFWKSWHTQHVANVLSPDTRVPTRHTQELWKAFHMLPPPPYHTWFLYSAIWERLPIGHQLRHWKPVCQADHQANTQQHVLTDCKHLTPMVRLASLTNCFPHFAFMVSSIRPSHTNISLGHVECIFCHHMATTLSHTHMVNAW